MKGSPWRTRPGSGRRGTARTYIRPVGAFLYFELPRKPIDRDGTYTPFALTPDSFLRTEADPYAPIRGFDRDLTEVLIGPSGCLKCHSFRGAGTRSHHARAIDGQGAGATALALESYPPLVWWQFLHDQDRAAKKIGVRPLHLHGQVLHDLYTMVAAERDFGGPLDLLVSRRGAKQSPLATWATTTEAPDDFYDQ